LISQYWAIFSKVPNNFFFNFNFFPKSCIYLEYVGGLLLIWILFFLVHELYFHSINGTTNFQKFNNIKLIFCELLFFKKWATLEYIHIKNSRCCSNNSPTWHMETFWAIVLGSTYKYFWTHIVVKPMLMPPNNSNRHTHSLRGCHWTSVDHIKVKGPPQGHIFSISLMGIGGTVFHVCKHIDQMPSPIKVKFPTSMVGHLWTKQNGMGIPTSCFPMEVAHHL